MAGIVFLRSNGRLGNQLIELLGAITLFPDKKIVAIDFDAAYAYLDQSPFFWWIGSNPSYPFLARLLAKFLWLIRKLDLRLINFFFYLVQESSSNKLRILPARLKFLNSYWINGPYFQNMKYLDLSLVSIFKPKEEFSTFAVNFLKSQPQISNYASVRNIFLHIRLGDYLTHDKDANDGLAFILPSEYYSAALKLILSKSPPDVRLFVASDQIEFAKTIFNDQHNCVYIDESTENTLSILASCDAGILSASSFSWWASHMALKVNQASGPFIAPKYWLGSSIGEWSPHGFCSEHLTYIDINKINQ